MIYNFSPGPAMLPLEVMRQVHEEFFNWRETGASIMEISHRGPVFLQFIEEVEADCRELLNLPSNYRILFLSGGARGQFAAIPLNLAGGDLTAAYIITGMWSKIASEEARRYTKVKIISSNEESSYTHILPADQWQNFNGAAYLHYTENETVHGLEFPQIPLCETVPLICDMSSSILSRPLDITRFGLIYAGTQKNIGIAGLTLVIIRDDLLERIPQTATPSIFNYALQVKNRSMYNTPPVFPWYMTGLILKWLKKEGGLVPVGARNQRKAEKLYQYIDQSGFYKNSIDRAYRSRMNVIFTLPDSDQEQLFLKQAEFNGLIGLKGHNSLGGVRASLYNAMPEEGVDALIDFMKIFVQKFS